MRTRLAIAGVVAAGLAGGCITPSIPIPPPEPTAMTFAINPTDGDARFTYAPNERYAGAVVYVFNRDQGTGIIDTADINGGVGPTAPFPAALDDQIVITFELDDQAASTCVRIREGTPTTICF